MTNERVIMANYSEDMCEVTSICSRVYFINELYVSVDDN